MISDYVNFDECLALEGPQNLSVIEQNLATLERGFSRLLIPTKLKAWWFGAEAALIQFLATWARRCSRSTLMTHIRGDDYAQLDNLVTNPFGFSAVWLARDVTDRHGNSIRVVATRKADDQYGRMWSGRQKGTEEQGSLWNSYDDPVIPPIRLFKSRVFLASVDHHPKWRIPQCYYQSGDLRDRGDFIALAGGIVRNATLHYLNTTGVPSYMNRSFGAVLHELFKNTHEWARTDQFGVPLRPSIRGLLASASSYTDKNIADAELDAVLISYIEHLRATRPTGSVWRCLEVSVFDSGVGLARRRLHEEKGATFGLSELTLEQEYDACKNCFRKWTTSSVLSHKGLGLHEVMTTLSQLRAFLRLRTGRLALFRDFIASPYVPDQTIPHPFLDWHTNSARLTECKPVEGVLYTMLIPLPDV